MLLLASLLLLFFSNAPGMSAFVDVPSVDKTPAVASEIMLVPVCHVPGLSAWNHVANTSSFAVASHIPAVARFSADVACP